MAENKFKVKLVNSKRPLKKGGPIERVVFEASPQITENRNVNYNSLEPLHAPGQIQVYKNTSSRNFNVSDIKLISRTPKEADITLRKLWILRGWCMPRFGNSSTLTDPQIRQRELLDNSTNGTRRAFYAAEGDGNPLSGNAILGAPPAVLLLSAYSQEVGGRSANASSLKSQKIKTWEKAQHINSVPVVIQQLTLPYPNDVDYINSTNGTPVPIIMNIDITLLESPSPNAYEGFSLNHFKQGILQGF